MIIDLPKRFSYTGEIKLQDYAKVEKGIFYIKGGLWPRDMMYLLTYALHREKTCFYCGKEIPKEKRTLDHMCPKALGGPTIPNNLIPSCETCNWEKEMMQVKQYKEFRLLSQKEKGEFRKKVTEEIEEARKRKEWGIPQEWVTYRPLADMKFDRRYPKTYQARKEKIVKEFFEQYQYLPSPVVVDVSNHLIEGYTCYRYALENHIQEIPVIVLGNVVIL